MLAFLEAGGLGAPVEERIETHAAVVLLAGDRAFKMKKAVRYSFLDFSTLGERRAALEKELTLNREVAPELYLGLVPVVRTEDGGLRLGGEGEVVEWLLEMRRFPQEARLDHVAARGKLDLRRVEELARIVADFHRHAPVRTDRGGSISMRKVVVGNRDDLRALVPDVFPAEEVEDLVAATDRAFGQVRDLLDVRRGAGRVRFCHGDLHLGNIVLLDGRPVLFDRIEFDEELACIDVLYDLAFLIMDLLARDLRAHAHRVLQVWNDEMVDDAGLQLLPLFLSLRAAIRAKVTGLGARQEADRLRRAADIARARHYLRLAREVLEPVPPRVVAIGGRSGTGKSSVALAIAPQIDPAPGAMVLRSDVVRKRLFGRRPTEHLPPEAYTPEVSAQVFETIAQRTATLLEAGRSVVCDAVYGRPEQRRRIEEVAREHRVDFRGFWLTAPEEVCIGRVRARTHDASDADEDVVRMQSHTLDESTVEWERIDAARPLGEVVAEIRARLGL
ncbi:hypothetical protein HRbin39_00621 [bacterium HR39]|nr:hypothetical protein HRbin39_00621 [bacterium HR39]